MRQMTRILCEVQLKPIEKFRLGGLPESAKCDNAAGAKSEKGQSRTAFGDTSGHHRVSELFQSNGREAALPESLGRSIQK